MANPSTDALEGLVIAKVDKIQNENEKIVEKFLKFFVSSVGIPQDYQNKFMRQFWFKVLVTFFISSVSCQFLHCFFRNTIGDIIQALVFILHSVFLNFATFFIFVRQKYIVEMVKIKGDYFSGFYEKSLVMRNYMTADDKFKRFLIKFGTTTCIVHFSSTVLSPLLHFIFSDAQAGSDETLILPSWYPWEIKNMLSYTLTFGLQFIQVTSLMVPILGNFLFVVYFVIEIRIQKTNLCTSLSNIVVYAYWESMSNESPIFQMLSASNGGNKSYDELLLEYLQDCIKHHILINLFIRNFIKCYNLVFIGCLAYSIGNLSLIAYSVVLLQKENASWASYITALEGAAVVIAFILLYCYLGEVITSINIGVRNELYDIKWYEQSAKYRSTMLTFMCLTQKDIVMKAGITHIASYQLFASVLQIVYQRTRKYVSNMIANHEKLRKKFIILITVVLNCMTVVEIDRKMNYFYKYWYSLFVFLLFVSVGSSATSVMITADNSYQLFLSAETAGAVFSVISTLLVSQFKHRYLIEIYEMLKNGIENKTIRADITSKEADTYAKCISWSHQYAGFFTMFVVSTIFSTLLQAFVHGDYDNTDGNTLLYPSRYPWHFDTILMYSFTYIWQLITTLPIFLIIWGNVTFTMIVVLMFQSYTDELVILTKSQFRFENDKIFLLNNDEYYEHLKKCIQLHQNLRSYFMKFKSWFTLLFNAEIAYVTVEISILLHSGLKEKQSYGNSVKVLFFMAVLLVQLYFHCNVGERFYEMNNTLTETLSDLVFDVENYKTQKLIIMFIQQTRIPYKLTGFKTFSVSLHTMTKILRLSYNFFNVLHAADVKIIKKLI